MSGMIAFRTITYFLITSLLSATVGLILVVAIQPGKIEGLKATLGNGEHYPELNSCGKPGISRVKTLSFIVVCL